jgi:ribosomal protein S3AE
LWAKELSAEGIFDDILKGKIQKELSLKLKKIYPLSLCEIRVLEVEKEKLDEKK